MPKPKNDIPDGICPPERVTPSSSPGTPNTIPEIAPGGADFPLIKPEMPIPAGDSDKEMAEYQHALKRYSARSDLSEDERLEVSRRMVMSSFIRHTDEIAQKFGDAMIDTAKAMCEGVCPRCGNKTGHGAPDCTICNTIHKVIGDQETINKRVQHYKLQTALRAIGREHGFTDEQIDELFQAAENTASAVEKQEKGGGCD